MKDVKQFDNLPKMTNLCVIESLAMEFSAVQVYSPASARVTSRMKREPSGS